MSSLRLSFACWDYDRMRALADGRVKPDGIELVYLPQVVEETFFRMAKFAEYDLAEMSFSSYTVGRSRENPRFIAIPVYPSRLFRHHGIWVSTKSGIKEPKDLIGKKVGMPEYQLTALVWMRGLMQDEYGVDVGSVTYYTGGQEEPGREEKIKLDLPAHIKVKSIPNDKTLSQMLADGEIDALYSPRIPSTWKSRPGTVRRLFEDPKPVEQAYYAKTKIFPIMHVLAIKRELYEANRWVAQTLFKAFEQSKKIAYEDLEETAAIKTMIPWQTMAIEETQKVLGHDWWSYGVEGNNRHTLNTFLRYHHEQGLSKRLMTIEDIFAPETLQGSFKI